MKSIIKDRYYNQVASQLKRPAVTNTFMKIIAKYVDRNIDNLSTVGPVRNVVFWEDKDRDPIFQLTGVDKNKLIQDIKLAPELMRSVNAKNPFNVLMVLCISFYHNAHKQKEQRMTALYLTLSQYPSLFAKYFKFEPNENIMSYTISSLSNKFKIKQNGTMLATLIDVTNICDEHYDHEVKRLTDADIALYISALKTRINSILKNITSEFMKYHNKGAYINYQEDNTDPDNFKIADSNSLLITRLAQAVSMGVSVNGPDMKCITLAAKMNKISVNDLRTAVTQLCKDKVNRPDIEKVISSILYDFLFTGENGQEDIKSTKFTLYAIQTYKKSNTVNTNIVTIKKILDKWLNQYSDRYKKTNVVSTINGFRKGLYMFWIFTIQRTKF